MQILLWVCEMVSLGCLPEYGLEGPMATTGAL